VSSAKVAYQIFKDIFHGEAFSELKAMGARPQRLLWASTSTKNPAYSDVKYVEALIGPETVNTVPLGTLNAYRDHGQPALRLEENKNKARENLISLKQLEIDLGQITQTLEDEGVKKFSDAYDLLINTLEKERATISEEKMDPISFDLGKYQKSVNDRIQKMKGQNFLERFWRKDPSLWKTDLENKKIIQNALGWMHVAEEMEENLPELKKFVRTVKNDGYQHVVHMGMGGSSLTPLVFQRIFKVGQSGIPLTVLDTTDPITISNLLERIPVGNTLFIVASKSGTTAEPLAFEKYFYARVQEIKGDNAGENFVAITDPGTKLEEMARKKHYRRIFRNFEDIGGRYSALSYFGLVPAALMGLDIEMILNRALRMSHTCISNVDEKTNLCLRLGAALGEMGLQGRDKITFMLPDSLSALGMWLEQLLAESTGKEGRGLLPVTGEPLGNPEVYGNDRVFIHFQMNNRIDQNESKISSLRKAGHPVVTIRIEDPIDLGQEFYRWEVATAIAGAVLGINAFNQPNVQESKDNTNKLIAIVEKNGTLPEEKPDFKNKYLSVSHVSHNDSMISAVSSFFKQANPGDFIAIMAYLPESPEVDSVLRNIREELRDKFHLATTIGYGPRFLHSTGQYHKGGPNTGLFILLTDENPVDEKIPAETYGFGEFKHAQAIGDLQALEKHGRRLIHLHLKWLTSESLQALNELFKSAIKD
jgi:transaldolase/glucose-6-phosphate isomerase